MVDTTLCLCCNASGVSAPFMYLISWHGFFDPERAEIQPPSSDAALEGVREWAAFVDCSQTDQFTKWFCDSRPWRNRLRGGGCYYNFIKRLILRKLAVINRGFLVVVLCLCLFGPGKGTCVGSNYRRTYESATAGEARVEKRSKLQVTAVAIRQPPGWCTQRVCLPTMIWL